jgi:hypothetical protein
MEQSSPKMIYFQTTQKTKVIHCVFSKKESKYISAFVTTNPETKKFSKPNPEELYAIETLIEDIQNLKRSIPTMYFFLFFYLQGILIFN